MVFDNLDYEIYRDKTVIGEKDTDIWKVMKYFVTYIIEQYGETGKIETDYLKCYKLKSTYFNIPYATFDICYDNGFILKNKDNCFKISTFIPKFRIFDSIWKELYLHRVNLTKNYPKPIMKQNTNVQPICTTNKCTTSQPKNINQTTPLLNIRHQKFLCDKKSYFKIKDDIDANIIKEIDINSDFLIKYDIFKILDSRDQLKKNIDTDLQNEYTLFTDFYNIYEEADDIITESKKPIMAIYIPPRYEYMTDQQKEDYAKKYKMTRIEFESKMDESCTKN